MKLMHPNEYYLLKPHHFLDYLYELSLHNEMTDSNIYGNNNSSLFKLFADGELTKIKFTKYVDDICYPCNKLKDNRCQDVFDEQTAKYYQTEFKNDFNYDLDVKLNNALPAVFNFDKVNDTIDILSALKHALTSEIIDLYKWKRPDRIQNTLIGIDKAIKIYKKRPN